MVRKASAQPKPSRTPHGGNAVSLDLAPQLVEEIFEIVARLNAEASVGFLVAEQNTNIALRYAGYGHILENGRVVMDGAAAALREDAAGRKSYRDVKFLPPPQMLAGLTPGLAGG